MPEPSELPSSPPKSAPARLQDLWPLVRRYGVSDDVARERVLDQASDAELTGLVAMVGKQILREINSYLDLVNNAEEACPYGDLAQAAMEAEILLRQRRAG